jgi:hypothetical protein
LKFKIPSAGRNGTKTSRNIGVKVGLDYLGG